MSYTTWVCPPDRPTWFHVNDGEGLSTGGPIDPDYIGPGMTDEQRCDGYYLWCQPSPHWRLATVEETSRALFSHILGQSCPPEVNGVSGS
jgi:hypothetical protein